ncbi:MAG: MBL fold metallo-hydrolase [Thermodesulfobacteriota bacterium]
MKFCTLASGSSGNSLYIDTGRTKILVDAGISPRKLSLRLKKIGTEIGEIDSVIVTHEHADHSSAITNLPNPVYVASSTRSLWDGKVGDLREFDSASEFEINDITVTPFSVSHDALDPVCFTIEAGEKKLGVATDVGCVTALLRERLRGSNALVIEFNHDERLLSYSPYPWELKQRIKGRLGHLSNNEAAGLLRSLLHGGLSYVVLAHMSKVNNSENIAVDAALGVLALEGSGHVGISVAPRNKIGEVLEI